PIPNPKIRPLLESIAPQKLLIVDRFISMPKEYSYISQEFEETTYSKLVNLLPAIKKYKKFKLFFSDNMDYPVGVRNAFNRFLTDYDIKGSIAKKYEPGSIKKDYLYFFISDTFLWELLRDCRNNEYVVGKDVGILSHNDHIAKQIVFGGITTISTDFHDMAKRAAQHVKHGDKIQVIMPFNLIRRNSL
ncbi:MAG: GntR family transcriptional regulator, partial [Bacteroidota bacterium]